MVERWPARLATRVRVISGLLAIFREIVFVASRRILQFNFGGSWDSGGRDQHRKRCHICKTVQSYIPHGTP